MSEEKIKILEMLKEGKITTEETIALLKQVQDEDRPLNQSSWHDWHDWDHRGPRPSYRPDFGWINDLRSAIEETTKNVLFPDEYLFGTRQERLITGSNIDNGIRALIFEGKNSPIRLETYGGDRIEAEIYYKTKSRWNPHLSLMEENGIFSLSYDDNALYLLGINIRVPETAHIGSVCLKNKNAPIFIKNIEAKKIELNTKNESIKVTDVKGESLYCKTKNASIMLHDVIMQDIDLQTSCSKISLEDVDANHAWLVTSNDKIDINNSDIVQLYAKTSNSPLRLENLAYKKLDSIYSIDAATTNGQISIYLPHRELKCRLRASTTIGGIFNELNDLEYQVSDRNYVEAQAHGYDTAQNKLNLNLQTTNHGIYIKQL